MTDDVDIPSVHTPVSEAESAEESLSESEVEEINPISENLIRKELILEEAMQGG